MCFYPAMCNLHSAVTEKAITSIFKKVLMIFKKSNIFGEIENILFKLKKHLKHTY
uniref:Uncharacterized protein n=1 Tax=Meloidogyne enterolobii TaxID=390850 RepID=A0A6V7Y1T4_MELEN|nr:unnamed protein product [Meloidogyne enterolobii]